MGSSSGTVGSDAPVIRLAEVSKRYAATQALTKVDFCVNGGEVHVLAGENGSGKSTLTKALAGIIQADAGDFYVDGRRTTYFRSAGEAIRAGIVSVSQEGMLVSSLSVAENILLGNRRVSRYGAIDWSETESAAAELLDRLGVTIGPRTLVQDLPPDARQVVEIARAFSLASRFGLRVLLLDEATSLLGQHQVSRLFEVVESVKRSGVAIVFISHRAQEMLAIGDRFTVLRAGQVVASGIAETVDEHWIFSNMVGSAETDHVRPKGRRPLTEQTLLKVEHLSDTEGRVQDVSLDLRAGETVGIAGVVGSGRTELLETIYGVRPRTSGEVTGVSTPVRTPEEAIRSGMGFVPEDRGGKGLLLAQSVGDNLMLVQEQLNRDLRGFRGRRRKRMLAREWCSRLDIHTSSIDTPVQLLSGGNQQKTLFARWVSVNPRVLLLDEPTRGIDLKGKKEIHDLIRDLNEKGTGAIIVSSEFYELIQVCHRILVLKDGSIVAAFERGRVSEETLLAAANGFTFKDSEGPSRKERGR